MSSLDLLTLRLFVSVCDTENMGRTALENHIAPSAVSKRLSLLESIAGVELLHRRKRSIQPTAAGTALLANARAMLALAARIQHDFAAGRSGAKSQLRILISSTSVAGFLFDAIAAFTRNPAHANVEVEITVMDGPAIVSEILKGTASIGICRGAEPMRGLTSRAFRDDHLAVVVHLDHPLANLKRCALEQTYDYAHIGMPLSRLVRSMTSEAAALAGRTIRYSAVLSTTESMIRAVVAKLGVTVLPRESCEAFQTAFPIRVIPLVDAWARRGYVICHGPSGSLSPAAHMLLSGLDHEA